MRNLSYNGASLMDYLRSLPDSAVRGAVNLIYKPVKDTVLLANGNTEGSFFTATQFAGGANKTKLETNMEAPGRGIFGNAVAWIVGMRWVMPRRLADGTTGLTEPNAHNLLLAIAELKIDGKRVHRAVDVEELPQGRGLFQQTAEAASTINVWCNGVPEVDNRFIFEEPIEYLPQESIEVLTTYPGAAGVVLTANAKATMILDAFVAEVPR